MRERDKPHSYRTSPQPRGKLLTHGHGDDGGDVGGDDLAVDVDNEHAGGGWSPPEVIPAAVPPSDLLRRQPSAGLFRGFVFLRRRDAKLLGGLFL